MTVLVHRAFPSGDTFHRMHETEPPTRIARRWQRSTDHQIAAVSGDLAAHPFRVDRDRVASSPFFARLAGVTQVVSPNGSGSVAAQPADAQPQGRAGGPGDRRAADRQRGLRAAAGQTRRLRPRRGRGRGARARPRPPAVRPPGRGGARPDRPAPLRPAGRVRGQRAVLPDRHHHRHQGPARHRPRPDRRGAGRDAQIPVDPARAIRSRTPARCRCRRGARPNRRRRRAPDRPSSPPTSPNSTTWSRRAPCSRGGSNRGSRPSRRP